MKAFRESIMDFFGTPGLREGSPERHLVATMAWLCAAQDAGSDDGVARMFHLKTGWGASYPETTGYIIPTFLNYSRLTNDPDCRDRALRMASWESAVQMADGAVQGGTIMDPPSPAIFNTGQVLFGWCAAYTETRDPLFRKSLTRAADYLVSMQDEDGFWRRNLSRFCSAKVDTYAYNVRSAWALLLAAEVSGTERYQDAARKNIQAVCGLAGDNGWVAKNCLNKPAQPLLHTIAYTYQGLFEGGVLANDERAIHVALEGNNHLLGLLESEGTLHGRYDQYWNPTVRWRCLTGEAQTAIVWFRLAEWTGDARWRKAATILNSGLRATQRLDGPSYIRGGIKGSYPVYGEYGQYEYLNWAAKFFADALMLELDFKLAGASG